MTDHLDPDAGDPTIDPATELASRLLDGDLAGADLARAEADPAVASELARLRTARAALRDVDAPDPAVREDAIAAALRAFDDLQAPDAAAAASAPVIPLPSRPAPRLGRWLGAAAAAVAVLAAGTLLVVGGGSDDDEASDGATSATAAPAETLSDTAERSEADADAGAGAELATEAAPQTSEVSTMLEAPEGTAETAGGAWQPLIASPDELAAVAVELEAAGAAAPPLPTSCPDSLAGARPVGTAGYATDPDAPETSGVLVVVLVDDDARQVLAVDATTCDVVAVAPTDTPD